MAGAYKYGLKKSPQPPALRFGSYLIPRKLPDVPLAFGHYGLFSPDGWGMLGNDSWGDCTVAGAMHAIMLWNKIAGINVQFSTADAGDDYFTITGGGDDGADMVEVAKYWQRTGFRDTKVKRHQIAAYLAVACNQLHYFQAAYFFSACGLGVQIPSSAQDQFSAGKPWSNVRGDTIEGYHYVPLVGRKANGNAVVITWGQIQEVEQTWLDANLQEVVCYISEEELVDGTTPEGFNLEQLQEDLDAIGA